MVLTFSNFVIPLSELISFISKKINQKLNSKLNKSKRKGFIVAVIDPFCFLIKLNYITFFSLFVEAVEILKRDNIHIGQEGHNNGAGPRFEVGVNGITEHH